MQHLFEKFLDRLKESVDEADLSVAMTDAAGELNIRKFAYLSLSRSPSETPYLISNYPSHWSNRYLTCRYERIDPVVLGVRRSDRIFCWGTRIDGAAPSGRERIVFDEAADFGICCGLTIPIHDCRGCTAAMTFAADDMCPVFPDVVKRYDQALQMMAVCFHIHARRLKADAYTVDGAALTRREFECLQWAARGKSAWDIGCILGISRRTVAFHLDNARKKLDVRTVTQAVARFASSRLKEHK